MSNNWKPTMQLRQVKIYISGYKQPWSAYEFKLQQLWEEVEIEHSEYWHMETKTGKTEWRDVPVMEEGK